MGKSNPVLISIIESIPTLKFPAVAKSVETLMALTPNLMKGRYYKKTYPDSPDSNQDFVEFFAVANTTTAGPDNKTLVEVSEADSVSPISETFFT